MAKPLRLELKRLPRGTSNIWFFEVPVTEEGVRFSTAELKMLWLQGALSAALSSNGGTARNWDSAMI